MSIRVSVCDDVLYIRNYFSDIINMQEDMELAGVAANGKEIIEIAEKEKPDVILMDIQMENEYAGVNATRKILEKNPDIKIIIITIHVDAEYISQAYLAGAIDYILKTDSKENVCRAIRDVYNGNEFVRPDVAKKFIKQFRNMYHENQSLMYTVSMVSKLTPAEIEILKELYNGKSRAEVAKHRFVEKDTIKFHVKNILKKMKYPSMTELIKDLKSLNIFDNYF